ncbi:hypothetical protein GW17_00031221 [Ensete ventricosum]|nr:hypothetical protein GW17_00031221 [Ensete ventricosum]
MTTLALALAVSSSQEGWELMPYWLKERSWTAKDHHRHHNRRNGVLLFASCASLASPSGRKRLRKQSA